MNIDAIESLNQRRHKHEARPRNPRKRKRTRAAWAHLFRLTPLFDLRSPQSVFELTAQHGTQRPGPCRRTDCRSRPCGKDVADKVRNEDGHFLRCLFGRESPPRELFSKLLVAAVNQCITGYF